MNPGGWTEFVVRERIAKLHREAEHQHLVRSARRGSKARRVGSVGWHGWGASSALRSSGCSTPAAAGPRVSSRAGRSVASSRGLTGPAQDSGGKRPRQPLLGMVRGPAERDAGRRDPPLRPARRPVGCFRNPRQGARSRLLGHHRAPHSPHGRGGGSGGEARLRTQQSRGQGTSVAQVLGRRGIDPGRDRSRSLAETRKVHLTRDLAS